MKSENPDYSPAMLAYKRCADMYPSSPYAGESYKRVIDYYISMKDYTRASETLERVFEDYPDAPWLDEMLLKWGVVNHRMGKREEAISKFRRVVEEYPGGKSARQAANFLKKLEE
jgi:TolA-binding protein